MSDFEVNAAQLENLIRSTVQAVLQERAGAKQTTVDSPPVDSPPAEVAKPPVASPMILVAVCCGECVRPEVSATLDELKRAGCILVEPGAHELKERATRERLVSKCDVVLMPSVGDDDAAKMALGIFDEPVSRVALSAIALGKPLIASLHSPYEAAMKNRSPVLFNLWLGYRKTLENFGFEMVNAEAIGAAVQARLAPKKEAKLEAKSAAKTVAPQGKNRVVITAKEIEAAAQSGQRFEVPSGALVTPLARDRARELGVKI